MKKALAIILSVLMLVAMFAGCANTGAGTGADANTGDGTATGEKPVITLNLWGSELPEYQAALRVMADNFIAHYADEATITIEIGAESESTAKDTVLTDIEAAADVFYFADDQIKELVTAGALQKVENADAIAAANGAGSVAASTVDGTLYAYPAMASNGYFLYYNSEYFTAEDVKSIDRILEVCAENGKQFTMQYNSGWYNYAFFDGEGLGLTLKVGEDGTAVCDWNSDTGVAVLQAMIDIAANDAFISLGDAEFQTGVTEGTIIAGINGAWNAPVITSAWGENYAATKLPTYTLNGEQVQMGSVDGYKLVGVNSYSENVGWAMRLAEWLTNAENQAYLYEQTAGGAIPSNIEAASDPAVASNPAVIALQEQSAYATTQNAVMNNNYWGPMETVGQLAADGNPEGKDLKEVLDEAVAGITAPIA